MTSSNYPNLYELMGEQNQSPPVNSIAEGKRSPFSNGILPTQSETQQSIKDRIKSSERLLLDDDNLHYIPEVEGFLSLISKRFNISRSTACAGPSKIVVDSVDLLGIGDIHVPLPPTAPVETVEPLSTQSDSPHTATGNDLKEIRDELRKTREEMAKSRVTESRSTQPQPIIINNTTQAQPWYGMPTFVPVYSNPAPVIISASNCSFDASENPAKRRKVEKEEDKKSEDDSLFRIMAFLGGLAVASAGLYYMAREAGDEVNEEEIDESCEKMSKVLTRLSDLNNLLLETELYNNLVQIKENWETYRKRVRAYNSEQSLNKKLIWGPIAGLALLAAVTPNLVGQASLIGLGAVFGWGTLNWIYTRTFYQSTGEKKDEAAATEIKTLVTGL